MLKLITILFNILLIKIELEGSTNCFSTTKKQAKVVVYKGQTPEKELLFDATGSDKLNWFSFDKLVTSSWTDISTEPRNYFSIQGGCDGPNCRAFFINRNYNGCSIDAGWLVFADAPWCQWENTAARRHHVLYSKRPTYSTWSSTGEQHSID